MSIYQGQFWKDTGERVVSSAAQGFITGGGLGALAEATDTVVNVGAIEWKAGGLAAAGMAVLTLAKALVAGKVNPTSGASFATQAVQLRPDQGLPPAVKRKRAARRPASPERREK